MQKKVHRKIQILRNASRKKSLYFTKLNAKHKQMGKFAFTQTDVEQLQDLHSRTYFMHWTKSEETSIWLEEILTIIRI